MAEIQAIRGMNDVLPTECAAFSYIEGVIATVLATYNYQEIKLPIVEKTELYQRAIGVVTDIVEKEMYTFLDRNQDSLTLRPEGTAGCVRAALEHGLLFNQIQRLWYRGPMFRHERPQKGRYRQFYQIGVEAFGIAGPEIDAELIALTARLWRLLGIEHKVVLQFNTLGTALCRAAYKEKLVSFFTENIDKLDEDSKRRLTTNPLRILDSKNKDLQEVLALAPKLLDNLDDKSKEYFTTLVEYLDHLGIKYQLNPNLVRGLDYYAHSVFEWVTEELGAQGTICAGGRYDGLIAQLGGKDGYAFGFALGMERVLALCSIPENKKLDIYVILGHHDAKKMALKMTEELHAYGLTVMVDYSLANFKNQFSRADKLMAKYAFVLGEEEIATHCISIKCLVQESEDPKQELIAIKDLSSWITANYRDK